MKNSVFVVKKLVNKIKNYDKISRRVKSNMSIPHANLR